MIGQSINNWTVLESAGKTKTSSLLWKCKCKCGHESIKTSGYLNSNTTAGCRYCHQGKRDKEEEKLIEQLVGKEIGTWTVMQYNGKTKYKSRQWLCECKCGKKKLFTTCYLTGSAKRHATTCKACELRNMETNNRLVNEIPNRFWRKFLHTAERRNLLVSISKGDALEVFQKQNGKCALTKISLHFTKLSSRYWRYTTASIDRIDSGQPYTVDNIQWVDKRINMMKQKYPQSEFIELCKLVAQNN